MLTSWLCGFYLRYGCDLVESDRLSDAFGARRAGYRLLPEADNS